MQVRAMLSEGSLVVFVDACGAPSLCSGNGIQYFPQPLVVQMINKNMVGIVKSLDTALKANNLEKVAATMDQFEKQFENLDVQSEFVEQAMGNQAALSTPEDDVNLLMQQVADEHGLDVKFGMPAAGSVPISAPAAAQKEDDLAQRLAGLRGK